MLSTILPGILDLLPGHKPDMRCGLTAAYILSSKETAEMELNAFALLPTIRVGDLDVLAHQGRLSASLRASSIDY